MYLAKVQKRGLCIYVLRRSFFDKSLGGYTYHQIFDLGENPSLYIHQLTERAVCFDEALESAVEKECKKDPTTILEDLLWDFLPFEQRQMIKDFRREPQPTLSPLSTDEKEEVKKYIHLFDRRRLFYIRYGAVDQSRIFRLNDKLYRPLLYKCRDEKEAYFSKLELSLAANELKKYIFVIFDLQKEFSENFRVLMPEALDHEKMDEVFVRELCCLNSDQTFWQDQLRHDFLREQLHSYVIRYFDSDFAGRSFANDFYQDFRAKHRKFRWPERKQVLSDEEKSEVFGKDMRELSGMGKKELARLFRQKAKQYHPDRGGKPEQFRKLLDAYEDLKRHLKIKT